MPHGHYDDEIWDEHRWEEYLNEIEEKSDQLRKFIASDSDEDHPRWLTLLKDNPDIFDAVDSFIEEELQIEDAYFFDEEPDNNEWDEDELDDSLWDEIDEEIHFEEFDDEDDFDEGEEWKELSNDFALSENGSIENLDIYIRARHLSVEILEWTESVHPKFHTDNFSDFVSNTLKIGAKLAGGYSFGFERDYIGGNIACTKKALYAANSGLRLLTDHLKDTPVLTEHKYLQLHTQLFELRNDIGIYVQELREQFNYGIE